MTGRSCVATTSIWADIVDRLDCGDHFAVESLIPVGGDAHSFEPSMRDRGVLSDAALVVANGGGLEELLGDTLDAVAGEGTPVLTLFDHVGDGGGSAPLVRPDDRRRRRADDRRGACRRRRRRTDHRAVRRRRHRRTGGTRRRARRDPLRRPRGPAPAGDQPRRPRALRRPLRLGDPRHRDPRVVDARRGLPRRARSTVRRHRGRRSPGDLHRGARLDRRRDDARRASRCATS